MRLATQLELKDVLQDGKMSQSKKHMCAMQLLTRLRQVCSHPDLVAGARRRKDIPYSGAVRSLQVLCLHSCDAGL